MGQFMGEGIKWKGGCVCMCLYVIIIFFANWCGGGGHMRPHDPHSYATDLIYIVYILKIPGSGYKKYYTDSISANVRNSLKMAGIANNQYVKIWSL